MIKYFSHLLSANILLINVTHSVKIIFYKVYFVIFSPFLSNNIKMYMLDYCVKHIHLRMEILRHLRMEILVKGLEHLLLYILILTAKYMKNYSNL